MQCCSAHIHNQWNTKWIPIFPSFLHILEVCVLSLTKRQPLPPSSSGCTCMPVHETPLLHTHTHTHVLPALSVTCEDRNSSRLRFGVCADTKNSTEGRRGDSVLAGSPAPRAKIGCCEIKIAVKREAGGWGASFIAFSLFPAVLLLQGVTCSFHSSWRKISLCLRWEREGRNDWWWSGRYITYSINIYRYCCSFNPTLNRFSIGYTIFS